MTKPPASEPDAVEPAPDRPTIAPFLGALAIISLVVIGIVVFNSGSDEGPTPDQEVGRAVVAQNDALQRDDYADYRVYTCRSQYGDEPGVIAGQRASVAEKGERYVDGIGAVTIDGDDATASVTYHFDNTPDDTVSVDLALVREDGAWKVCSPGPS